MKRRESRAERIATICREAEERTARFLEWYFARNRAKGGGREAAR